MNGRERIDLYLFVLLEAVFLVLRDVRTTYMSMKLLYLLHFAETDSFLNLGVFARKINGFQAHFKTLLFKILTFKKMNFLYFNHTLELFCKIVLIAWTIVICDLYRLFEKISTVVRSVWTAIDLLNEFIEKTFCLFDEQLAKADLN